MIGGGERGEIFDDEQDSESEKTVPQSQGGFVAPGFEEIKESGIAGSHRSSSMLTFSAQRSAAT